jgi:hypothetical protein
MKQTAIEWLERELNYIPKGKNTSYIDLKIKQAKEIERAQIVKAYEKEKIDNETSEQYYVKTYK